MDRKISCICLLFAFALANARTVSVSNLSELKKLTQDKKAVLKFSAVWCGPCRTSTPVFEEFSTDVAYKDILFIKVDVDAGKDIARSFRINGIPAFVFVKDNKVVNKVVGIDNLRKNLTNHLDRLAAA